MPALGSKKKKYNWSHAHIGQQKNMIGHTPTLGSKVKHDWSYAHNGQQNKT